MNKYNTIIEEVSQMWEESAEYKLAAAMGMGDDVTIRNYYMGLRIKDLYGMDYLTMFVEEHPDIAQLFKPCDYEDGQCSMICYYFKNGGCSYITA